MKIIDWRRAVTLSEFSHESSGKLNAANPRIQKARPRAYKYYFKPTDDGFLMRMPRVQALWPLNFFWELF